MLLKGAYCVGEHFVDPQSTYMVFLIYFCCDQFKTLLLNGYTTLNTHEIWPPHFVGRAYTLH